MDIINYRIKQYITIEIDEVLLHSRHGSLAGRNDKNEIIYNGTGKDDFLLNVNFYNNNDESSNISNSSEVKELYPRIFDDVVGNPDSRAIRKKNLNKLIIPHLNVNSLRNKLEFLKEQIHDNVDILMISESKIDAIFPIG